MLLIGLKSFLKATREIPKTINQKLKNLCGHGASFASMILICELIEEALEELIAWGLSWALTKAISIIFAVTITQGFKLIVKRFIKKITYRNGGDKMDKVKQFFCKLGEWFKTNPITIATSGANLAGSGAVGMGIYIAFNYFGWQLPEWAMYLIIGFATVGLACLTEWGILCKGWETKAEKALRLAAIAAAAEEKRIEAEAAKKAAEMKAEEERLAAEARARFEAEEKAKADAIAAEVQRLAKEEHDKKVAAKVAEMRKAQQDAKV